MTGVASALVDVRAPEVERHRRDLEAEAGEHQQGDGVDREAVRVRDAARQVLLDPGHRGRAGEAVEQREAVQHRAGGRGAEQHVLERRLVRHAVALQVGHHHVGRDRDHLEGEVQHHDVVRGGEQQARQHQRQHQREKLPLAEAVELARVAEAEGEHRQQARRDQDQLERGGERIDHQHAGEEAGLDAPGLELEREAEGRGERARRQQPHREVARRRRRTNRRSRPAAARPPEPARAGTRRGCVEARPCCPQPFRMSASSRFGVRRRR